VTAFWLKYRDLDRCLRRVTQPPHIAGPLGVIAEPPDQRPQPLETLTMTDKSQLLYKPPLYIKNKKLRHLTISKKSLSENRLQSNLDIIMADNILDTILNEIFNANY
jgi:hypothetical protein